MTKIWGGAKSELERGREKSLETFEKVSLKRSRSVFFKNLIHDIRLIEKQFRSIETDRGSPKILKEILIDWKQIGSIKNMEKQNFREKQLDFLKHT